MGLFGSVGKSISSIANPSKWGSKDDPLLGGPLGDFIPGIGDARAQDEANRVNIALAKQNRDWQEKMSSTAYQRGMGDMKKAGLNPMLAYMQGGASTPSSAAATVESSSKTGLAAAGMQAFTGISAARTQAQQAATAQAQSESSIQLQAAQTAQEVAKTEQVQADTALKKRELRGKGIKETLDREGGKVIQNLIDKIQNPFKTSAKDAHENKKIDDSIFKSMENARKTWGAKSKPNH